MVQYTVAQKKNYPQIVDYAIKLNILDIFSNCDNLSSIVLGINFKNICKFIIYDINSIYGLSL